MFTRLIRFPLPSFVVKNQKVIQSPPVVEKGLFSHYSPEELALELQQTLNSKPENPDLWSEVFKEKFSLQDSVAKSITTKDHFKKMLEGVIFSPKNLWNDLTESKETIAMSVGMISGLMTVGIIEAANVMQTYNYQLINSTTVQTGFFQTIPEINLTVGDCLVNGGYLMASLFMLSGIHSSLKAVQKNDEEKLTQSAEKFGMGVISALMIFTSMKGMEYFASSEWQWLKYIAASIHFPDELIAGLLILKKIRGR